MSEPEKWATDIEEVVPGLFRWSVEDDRVDGRQSDAHALVFEGRVTLIDPLPIHTSAIFNLGTVDAIVLTAGNHQRAAWRLRRELGAPVFAPQAAAGLEERANGYYLAGESLPGGLIAFHTPGPIESMHAMWRPSPASVVFMADLLTHDGNGTLRFVPAEYQDEPGRTRQSVRRILEQLDPKILCFSHGPPLLEGVRDALGQTLRDDHELADKGLLDPAESLLDGMSA
ncbi:MAG: MBL fold metallo-hydrolase [Myxococcaceae bacterium]